MTQINTFLETYRLFNNQFIFKGGPLREYLMSEMDKVAECKELIDETKKKNPELAAAEDSRVIQDARASRRDTFLNSSLRLT